MRRALIALLAAITAAVVFTGQAGAAAGVCNSWPTGAPTAAWQGTIQASLQAATPGSVVVVPPGTYPGQTVTYVGSTVVCSYVDASAATFGTLEMDGAQEIWIRGATLTGLFNVRLSTVNNNIPSARISRDLVFEDFDAKTFLWRNVEHIRVIGGAFGGWDASINPLGPPKVGAYIAESGAPARLSNDVVIDGTVFHDMLRTLAGTAHAECFYFDAGVDGLTIRNSTFTNCGVFDIFSNGISAGRPITNVLIEGNLLDVPRDGVGGAAPSVFDLKGGASNWTIRGNSILGNGGTLRNDTAAYPGFVFDRNAVQNSSFGWIGPATWTGNVMTVPGNTGSVQANPVGFVAWSLAPCDLKACYRNDLHVLPGSPAGLAGAGVPVSTPPPPPAACADGIDNDNPPDGKIDYPADPGCVSASDTDETDPPPPPPVCPGTTLPLTVVTQDTDTITFGWAPVQGAVGYRFNSTALGAKWTHTWDATRSTVKFAKGSACYRVQALGVLADGGASG